jgi:hypothetical protein
MDFMTTEGDRSGVEIPSHMQKAANVIHSMVKRLDNKETYSIDDITQAINDLNRAKIHLELQE